MYCFSRALMITYNIHVSIVMRIQEWQFKMWINISKVIWPLQHCMGLNSFEHSSHKQEYTQRCSWPKGLYLEEKELYTLVVQILSPPFVWPGQGHCHLASILYALSRTPRPMPVGRRRQKLWHPIIVCVCRIAPRDIINEHWCW